MSRAPFIGGIYFGAGPAVLPGSLTIGAPTSGVALTLAAYSNAPLIADIASLSGSTATVRLPLAFTIGSTNGSYPFAGYNWAGVAASSTTNYVITDFASRLQFSAGGFVFQTAPSGTAGSAITWANTLAIGQAGNVTINAPSSGTALTVTAAANSIAQFVGASGLNAYIGIQDGQAGTRNWRLYSGLTAAGTFDLYDTTAAATRVSVDTAGNVTINAPSSGAALKAVAVSGSAAISSTSGPYYADNNSHPAFVINSNGTDYGMIAHVTGNLWCLGSGTVLNTTGVNTLQWNNTGNVTINAPSSGTALTVNGAVSVVGSAATALAAFTAGGTTTAQIYYSTANTGGSLFYGVANSGGTGTYGSTLIAYAGHIGTTTNTPLQFATNNTPVMTLDASGNLGLGVTPNTGYTVNGNIDFGGKGSLNGSSSLTSNGIFVSANLYYGAGGWAYKASLAASQYLVGSGQHIWYIAPSGTAGNAATLTQAMTLDASGNLGVGVTPSARLHLKQSTTNGLKIESVSNDSSLSLYNSSGTEFRIAASYGTTGSFQPIVFYTSDLARMTIDASGNLLVGTTTNAPTSRLSVSATTSIACAAYGTDPSYVSTVYYGSTVRSAAAGFDFIGMYANGTQMFQVNGTGQCRITDGTSTSLLFVGYLGLPQSSNTTLALADRGKSITATGTITVPNATFSGGDTVVVYNNSAAPITLSASITTMRLAGTATTGSRTIAQRGWATIYFVSGTECSVGGAGVS